jgi:hypothetical protein
MNELDKNTLDWLLEPADIGVRYLALRDLVHAGPKDLDIARKQAHEAGPIAAVLAKMEKEGYWVAPGPGYNPKYTATVWSIILLSQLGADIRTDPRIETACVYLLKNDLANSCCFTVNGLPSGTVDCLQGNLCAALVEMGYQGPWVDTAFEWMARTITGEGIAPMTDKTAPVRYYASKCGPNFACGANDKKSCAWGAVKVMLAFSKLPEEKRTPLIDRAIKAGVDFLFSKDPADADYPSGYAVKPSGNWWKFGFPVFYITDILQIVEALLGLGYGKDPRLARALDLIREKRGTDGRWPLEYDYTGKTWVDFGPKKQTNKWVTLRAMRVLQATQS